MGGRDHTSNAGAVGGVSADAPLLNGKPMREFVNTAIIIALIAIAVVLLLLAPKGFQIGQPDPVVSLSASGLPAETPIFSHRHSRLDVWL